MKALQFDVTVPRYIAGRILGAVYKPLLWSGLSCLRYQDVPQPAHPDPVPAALPAILRHSPNDGHTESVPGAGVISLCTVAAFRALSAKEANRLLKAVFDFA